jgi:glyoxylase-like metal-dependent hydrolase (beta-lactamase superfamily II)
MDHVGALNEVKKAIPGATFAIHQEDAPFLTRRGLMGAFLGTPGPPADMMLHGGETLKAGDLSFKVIHTPGHSPGGICLYGMDTLFSGDTLFRMGIGRYDFPGCSGQALLASIKEKLFLLPDDTVVYPGHGPQTTIGDEKRGNPFLTGAAELD